MTAEEGFLARWSRRKRGLEAEAPVAAPAVDAVPAPDAEAAEAEFDPASLPPVETLGLDSDFAAFLRPRVPAALRQAALRRMWPLDPAIRDFIGPADYAWDYNVADGVPGFAPDLGEEVARRLLALLTAPSEPQPPAEDAEAAPDPAAPEPEAVPAPPPAVALAAAAPPPVPGPSPGAAPRARRHGGAVPV